MSTFRELRQRRFVQFLVAYLAASWVVIEVISQLVEHEILPGIVYRLVLVWFLGGLPCAAVVAWFHGEQGRQKAPRSEIAFISVLVIGLGIFTFSSVSTYLETNRALAGADEGGLPSSRIAVLYLADRSRGDLGAIADAFTEDLIAELARVPELDVVSANGVRPYRGETVDATEVARALGAGTIVVGEVGETRQGVTVDLALVDGASGAVFRRTSLEVPAAELLQGGTRLARESATLLRERLGEEVRLRETRTETSNAAAWSLLQQGRRAMKDAETAIHEGRGEEASAHYVMADSLLDGASRLDSEWARPLALRSEIAYRRARLPAEVTAGLPHTLAAIRLGDAAVTRDATDAGALEARGTARYWRWLTDPELEGAVRAALLRSARDDLESAVQRDPRRASAFSTLSHLYYNDPDAPGLTSVLMAAQRAYEEDAYVESAANVLWRIHTAALDIGQFPPAQNACREGRARFPGDFRFRVCRLRLMATPAVAADPAEGWRLLFEADSLAPDRSRTYYNVENRMFMAAILHRAGLADSARATLARAARDSDDPSIDPHRDLWLREAIVRSRIGETEEAVALVERYLVANPGHRFDQGYGLSWWWRELEPAPSFRRLLALQTQNVH
jgi:eukaryotic-like serine/threonine-protein kinase